MREFFEPFEAFEPFEPLARVLEAIGAPARIAVVMSILAGSQPVVVIVERFEIHLRRIDGRKITHSLQTPCGQAAAHPHDYQASGNTRQAGAAAGAWAPRENYPA